MENYGKRWKKMENDNDGKLWKMMENDNDGKGTAVICRMAASAGSGRARLAHAALRHLALYLSLLQTLSYKLEGH